MYRITKQFYFSASHQLKGLSEDHPCSRLHGHNYTVEIEMQAHELSTQGFVRDYHDLSTLKAYIDDHLDHRHLNDVLGDDCTTAEQIAKHLFDWCKSLWVETSALRVSETQKTWAEYRP